jgi:multisubunit Na+/H+ antiporter MnhF subunit
MTDPTSLNNTSPKTYWNTLIFTIVASLVSLIILFLLIYYPSTRDYVVGALIVEVGILTIIIMAIYSAWSTEKKLKEKRDPGTDFNVTLTACPDYFLYMAATSSNVGATCVNGFPSGSNIYYFAKQNCTGVTLTDPSCTLDGSTTTAGYSIDLKNYDQKTVISTCSNVNTTSVASPFYSIPWTDVKERCNSLNLH